MPREIRRICQDCRDVLASGIWRIYTPDGQVDAKLLCAKCGLHDYAKRREAFSPGIRTELFKTLDTPFVQADLPAAPGDGSKHWADHKPLPDYTYPNGMTGADVIRRINSRNARPSSVPNSILNQYRR